jgi:hypothetical protein
MDFGVSRRKFIAALTSTLGLHFWKPWLFASGRDSGGHLAAPSSPRAGEELTLWFEQPAGNWADASRSLPLSGRRAAHKPGYIGTLHFAAFFVG